MEGGVAGLLACTLEANTKHDTICERREKGYVRIRKTERRTTVRQLGLSVGRGSKHANEKEEKKWGREGYLYASLRQYEQGRYAQGE